MSEPRALVEHFFRHEFGRLCAVLTRSLGVRRLALVEDVVQAALVRDLETWSRRGVSEDPAGWLYRTARNLARIRDIHLSFNLESGNDLASALVRVGAESPPALGQGRRTLPPGLTEGLWDCPTGNLPSMGRARSSDRAPTSEGTGGAADGRFQAKPGSPADVQQEAASLVMALA